MEAEKLLVDLGLTEGESKVYLALLELGSSTVGPVVKKSGIAYSNIYEVLGRLVKKGLASFVVKGETKYFQAASPSDLYSYIEKKEKEIEAQKETVSKILPQLKNLQEKMPEQEAEIFLGLKGMRAAYTKLAAGNRGGEWLFFYIHEHEYAEIADRFYLSIKDILKIPDATKGIGDIEAKKSKFTKYASKKLVDYRFVDFPLPGNIDIYKNKVLLQAWSENPVAFLIKSPLITSLLTRYFESVWKIAKK